MKPDMGRFALGKGRERPAFKPLSLKCPQCGGSLEVKDERAELVVCPFCSSHLEVSGAVLKVLGRGSEERFDFPLEIGQSYRHKGARYEVIARMAFNEEWDRHQLTRQYCLYNPRLGTLWLDEYQGHWSLSEATHVMPVEHPFSVSRGATLRTHDGKTWVAEETGEYQLVFVDGSLPWLATVGDRIQYAEFSAAGGSGEQYEVQLAQGELEYGRGKALTPEHVQRATGKAQLPSAGKSLVDSGQKRRWYHRTLAAAALILVLNLLLAGFVSFKGSRVLRQSFTPEELTKEALTEPFLVRGRDSLIQVTASVPSLSNAWMAVDFGVVRGDDTVLHVFDSDVEYYSGTEGGEHWSEGSRSASTIMRIPEPGSYRLLVHAVSAHGNTPSAERAEHALNVEVATGVWMARWHLLAAALSGLVLLFAGLSYAKWRGWVESDDDDD